MATQSDSDRWERVKDVLHQAMQLAAEQRSGFLAQACEGDVALRNEIESLLAADGQMRSTFLQFGSWPTGLNPDCDPIELVPDLAPGQIFEQRYRLLEKLGEGGMGQVWLADQQAPVRRPVALKLIRAGMYDAAVVHRFRSERQSLAIMDHPCIAKVFDAGATAQGQPYFVMEYVPGRPITQYCDEKALSIAARIELFIKACGGVQHAHQKAIIHRDLKPANILVIEVDGVPTPRIIDFGLARPTAPRVAELSVYTHVGQFLGTPGYMAPEQAHPESPDIDTRADVYSLGVVLYVLLTGMKPFETKRRRQPPLDEWLRQLRTDDPQRPSAKVIGEGDPRLAELRSSEPKRLARLLRGDLDSIALKALSRDREQRYSTPAELVADLRHYLLHEPVVARPATAAYQLRKLIRRHRIGAALATVIILFATLASIAGLLAMRKQHEAEYQAMLALQAQEHLLTQIAAGRLKDFDVGAARKLILAVLTNPGLPRGYAPSAITVFQEVRAQDAELAVLSGHTDRVFSAVFSIDGSQVLTAAGDGTARIWDARTGAQLAILTGHTDRVFCAVYSPDGSQIATASLDGTARLWDARSGESRLTLSGHTARVNSVAFAPDGMHVVTGSWDQTARVWDARSGAQLTVLSGHGEAIYSAAYSPDGGRIVTASQDKTARVWDARTGKPLLTLTGHGDYVASAVYSPDGKYILTASGDKTARTWDALTGARLSVLAGHGDVVYSAAYSPDQARIVTGSWDKTARIWNAQSGAPLAVLSGHNSTIASAAYSPDGSRVVTASQDRTARIWDAHDGAQLRVLRGHTGPVSSAAFSTDGRQILTASADGTARIWTSASAEELERLAGHGGAVDRAAYSPDGTRIATSSLDKTVRTWDGSTGAPLQVLRGHGDRVYAVAFSPDGKSLLTASRDKTARVWSAESGAALITLAGHGDRVYFASYSPDGARIVSASRDRTARIWDARSGAPLATLSGHADEVMSAVYSPDEERIVTASLDGTARTWNSRTGAPFLVLSGHEAGVTFAAYSPDGKSIVTASRDHTVRIWDARSGAQLEVLAGHADRVNSAVYSQDGRYIVSASDDRTARLWDARLPADLHAQILWYAAAEIDPLTAGDRAALGLPADPGVKTWSTSGSACDLVAAAFYDPDRVTVGVPLANISADAASSACSGEVEKPRHEARFDYQLGRVLLAKRNVDAARASFARAISRGYRVARVDLADSMAGNPLVPHGVEKMRALYEEAWADGVAIAASRLGDLYEQVASDSGKAWQWYQRGAQRGQPDSLARFGARDELAAVRASDRQKREDLLLSAFDFYSAAALRARAEGWPDEAWRYWRYRQASLARALAQEGLMSQVASAYQATLDRWSGARIGRVQEIGP